MSKTERIRFTTLSEDEVKKINYATLSVRGRELISGVHLEHYSDGKVIAGFALFSGNSIHDHNAHVIGKAICKLYPEVNEVWHNAHKVYAPNRE